MSISSRFTAEHGAIRFAYMDVGEGREQDAEASLIAPYGFGLSQSKTWLTRPSASLGSNQVDFGGITSPASATAINASMVVA